MSIRFKTEPDGEEHRYQSVQALSSAAIVEMTPLMEVPQVLHRVPIEGLRVRVHLLGGCVEEGADERVDQQLMGRHRLVAVTGHERHDRGEVPAGALPADSNPARVTAELAGMGRTHVYAA